MNIPIIKNLEKRLSVQQRQWAWFIVLWLAGLIAVASLAYVIRLLMGIE